MASIEPYTSSRIDYLAKYLQSLLPGLNYDVAKTWITSEKGVSGNVLGTTYTKDGKQRLFTYPSQEAGLEAAANWIKTRSIYAGVNTSLSGTAQQQAVALANSPWNRSYYTKVFSGLMGGQTSPSGGASTPLTDAPNKAQVEKQITDAAKYGEGLASNPIGTIVGDALGIPDMTSAIMFIGVILVGITLIATGGIISLKGKT